ncbi:NmrA-like protein [Paramyrothecium foliicola]|nr:NmrA-like protein [Paramyrothecium foliicola]
MEGQDVVISMVGPTATGDQQILVDAALAAGVKRFFPSEFGTYPKDPNAAELNPIVTPPKAALVDYLRSKESEMSWTSIITGGFFDWGLQTGFFGFDFATKTATLIDGGTSRFTNTTLPTIAKAVVAAVDQAEQTKNQYVFTCSFNVSQKEILDAIGKVDWTIKHVTSEEVLANGKRRLAQGDFSGIMDLTRSAALGKRALADTTSYGIWNDKLGLPLEDLNDVIKGLF